MCFSRVSIARPVLSQQKDGRLLHPASSGYTFALSKVRSSSFCAADGNSVKF